MTTSVGEVTQHVWQALLFDEPFLLNCHFTQAVCTRDRNNRHLLICETLLIVDHLTQAVCTRDTNNRHLLICETLLIVDHLTQTEIQQTIISEHEEGYPLG